MIQTTGGVPLDFADPDLYPELGRQRKKPQTSKIANWVTCAEIEPKELLWLWFGKIPLRHLTMFAGDPSLGKTLMAMECMARGSRGENFLDGTTNSSGVFETIFLSAEDDAATIIIPRLMAADADLSKIHLVDTVRLFDAKDKMLDERLLTLDSDLSVLRDKLQAHPAIKLVVVDPLSNYLGSKDLNREQEVRSVLTPLIRLAQEFSVAVVIIAHHSKQTNRNAMHKVIGAVGAVGAGRMGWTFAKSPQDENTREMCLMKQNLGTFPGIRYATESVEVEIQGKKTQQARIKFLCESTIPIENILASADDQEERRDKPAISFLKKNLPKDGDTRSNSLIEAAAKEGISKDQLLRARKKLDIQTSKHDGGWWWRWPEESENSRS